MPEAATRTPYASALSPEYALMGLMALKPDHGYNLHSRLQADLGQIWRISLSQTYNILARLEARGLIAGSVQSQAKLPARHRYHLTSAGRGRFNAWLREPTGLSARAIRVEFITRLYFARATDPALAGELIDAQIAATQSGLNRLRDDLDGIPPSQTYNRLGLDLRIRQLASALNWLTECRDALNESVRASG